MVGPVKSLLGSRKFLIAITGIISAYAARYVQIPEEVIYSGVALLIANILGIAVEDYAEKSGPQQVNINEPVKP